VGRRTALLTGRLHDAAPGVRAVSWAGGILLAKDPDGCVAPGMPIAALATGCVDHSLPLAVMRPGWSP